MVSRKCVSGELGTWCSSAKRENLNDLTLSCCHEISSVPHTHVICVTHHKKLKCILEYYENSNTNARWIDLMFTVSMVSLESGLSMACPEEVFSSRSLPSRMLERISNRMLERTSFFSSYCENVDCITFLYHSNTTTTRILLREYNETFNHITSFTYHKKKEISL